jgi:hypothetical protein
VSECPTCGQHVTQLIDAEPVRRHLHALVKSGANLHRIALASGISYGSVYTLAYGVAGRTPTQRVKPTTAEALLSVTVSA